MSTCNRLDLQTLGSQPIMPKNLPEHCLYPNLVNIIGMGIIGNYWELLGWELLGWDGMGFGQHYWDGIEDLNIHLMSMRIFTLTMNKTCRKWLWLWFGYAKA
jgi:hypothetical protein